MFLYSKAKKDKKKSKKEETVSKDKETESKDKERPQFKKLGPVQFAIGQSLNKVEEILIRNTRVVPTLEKGARSGTFGEKPILKYSLIVFHGFLNQVAAKLDKDDPPLTEEDVMKMMLAMWHGTNELNTSSKFGQISRFLLRIVYSDELGYIGDLDKKIILANSNIENISDISEAEIEASKLISTLNTHKDIIKKIQYACHDSLNVIVAEWKESDNGEVKRNLFLGNILEKWAEDHQKQCDNILCLQIPSQTHDLKFKVVEDEPSISIFIEINDEAENVWKEYQAITKITDVAQKGKRLRSFFRVKRHIFYNYVISSYPEIVERLGIQFEKPFFYVEKRLLSNYYNVTGLRRN